MNATRPPQQLKLTIHEISGALVRDVSQLEIKANGNAMGTHKFVYEYDWDGKNDRGDAAAPGVYLYRFKADDSATSGHGRATRKRT